jgi:hypothetical protein
MGALGEERLGGPGVVLVGTVSLRGEARISPVEPLFWNGDLWLSMLWGSRKAADLLRDPRVLVHSAVASRDGSTGEYKVRGRACSQPDPEVQAGYADAVADHVGWRPEPGRFHLFWVDVNRLTFIRYEEASGDQFVTSWPPAREYVRRASSATSLGEPEEHSGLLG